MSSTPLHPAIAHVPLGLAFVIPLFALVFALVLSRRSDARRLWIVILAMQAIVLGGAAVAVRTGQGEESRVEKVVAERVIEEHEERGEQFLWAAGLAVLLSLGALVAPRAAWRGAMRWVAVAASLAVAVMAYRVGHSGGELVYVHGAARAFSDTTSMGVGGEERDATPRGSPRDESGSDDDRGSNP